MKSFLLPYICKYTNMIHITSTLVKETNQTLFKNIGLKNDHYDFVPFDIPQT